MGIRVVYSPHYDIGFFGLERLHPFDSRKYSRAWRELWRSRGKQLRGIHVRPPRQVTEQELLLVHTPQYLAHLQRPGYVALALELPIVKRLPRWLMDYCILKPMRWAVMGTVVAAREALQHGLAINLSGGYHHAKPDEGEGFSIYSDAALAVTMLRRDGTLVPDRRIIHVDLDAHQGNGVCYQFRDDRQTFIFDMYNYTIYPSYDQEALERIDCPVRIHGGHTSTEYLTALQEQLPGFLDSVASSQPIQLAFYNAGTDVFEHDQLGGLNVTAADVLRRDLFVADQLRQRGIPMVMLLSGGYSRESYQLVYRSIDELIQRYYG